VIESERWIQGKSCLDRRLFISSLPAQAERIAGAVRQHWAIENTLHWCMDVVFADDQMRARCGHAAHNMSVLKYGRTHPREEAV
jgi:predicted transposase YbfD/YdcC